ncbi:PIN domain-containing protein [Actinomyces sp. zg-332]|uniref:PIN domain-containing protein n=1 Tax=Actinomyces sp. zg-332 TaxID=2708340 RepID=UPI00141F1FED|nr:PIN domain-containing protein [Actinomyces sp. zg-332]QPK94692.1 PIN domain-containing protein [Actinomyces sp. zg-332]
MLYKVVLDTNVLVPSILRDVLLSLANEEIYKPVWSNEILEELERTLLVKLEVGEGQIKYLFEQFKIFFPDSCYDLSLYSQTKPVGLKDKNDEHVIRLALVSGSETIVTENLQDFPKEKLPEDIEVINSKEFLLNQLDLEPKEFFKALENVSYRQQKRGKNLSVLDILQILEEKHNCKGIIKEVKQYGYTFNNE